MARALIPNSTQVPDVIIDQWMAVLSGAEFKVLLYIARRTYGFGKEADNISLNQLANGIRRRDGTTLDRGTGLSRSGVKAACNSLIEKGLLIRTMNTSKDGREPEESTYRLNLFAAIPAEEEGVGQGQTYPGQILAYPEVGQKKNPGRPKSDPGVGQNLALQETGLQETEQETAAPVKPDADDELIETLVREGVGRSAAVRLAASKPDMCRRYLDWLPFADVKTTRGTWLANAIEHEFGPPKRLTKQQAEDRKSRGGEQAHAKPPRDAEDERGKEFVARMRVAYARLEEIHPEAIAVFKASFAAEQDKATKFAETLTEKGRSAFFEQSASEEFRLVAFDRWMKSEGRKYIATTQAAAERAA
jgi:hypothetical protein